MQGFFGVYGFLIFCMIYCWFPETSQPGSRGIDEMRAESGGNSKDHFYFINPLRPLLLLRSPNLFLIVSTRWLHVEIVPNDLVLTIPMSQSIILSSSLLSFFGRFIFHFSYVNRSDKMKFSPCGSYCVYHRMSIPFLPALSKRNVWKGTRYNITNGALIGACFVPSGLGTICNYLIFYWYVNAK